MQPNMNQATSVEVWAAFWHLAQAVCADIEREKPEMIVVLHCSGAVAWHAVQRLWQATRTQPLPPMIALRVAQHSADVYWNQYEPNEWEYLDEEAVGHMVAWAARRESWRSAAAERLAAAVGSAQPSTVLVVDDVVDDGWTALMAFGVLWSVLPHARVRLWAGVPGYWREILGLCWINILYPAVEAQMDQHWPQDKAELYPKAWWLEYHCHWASLVSGLIGGDDKDLSSAPLGEPLSYGAYLTRYMPTARWLELSHWVYATLAERIDQWASGAAAAPDRDPNAYWYPRPHSLRAEELAWTQAWFQRWSTLDDYAHCCHLPTPAMAELLHKWIAAGNFADRELQGVTCYGRRPAAGILLYSPFITDPEPLFWEDIYDRETVTTPFAVEFARSEPGLAGASVLVPVLAAHGAPVQASLLSLDLRRDNEDSEDLLYRAALEQRVPYRSYREAVKLKMPVPRIAVLRDFANVAAVCYRHDDANLDFVLDPGLPDAKKGERLAALAVISLTPETFGQDRDGIQYLIDTISSGVETRLTSHYRDALLRLADDAPNLAAARARLAQQRGLV